MGALGVWFRRLAGVNPLIRTTDRWEAALLSAVVAVAIATIPVAGAVGTATYDRLSRTYTAERAVRQEITATARADSREVPQAYGSAHVTSVAWSHDGVAHTDDIDTPRLRAGDEVPLWVDGDGNRSARVPSDTDAAVQAVVTALGLWIALAGVAAAAYSAARMTFNSMRFAAWDRELDDLADNGGRTNIP
ncbi:hypothetical protein [Mycobacterium sp. PSTR-4-N]|uniref:Rv1733c family protein n=1 Tax=Mycobacterium sp. PSTR-4-N TaxID=2917745 RepID=UPI001F14CC76|nr:hypothetical protein [Mycobacterium sp. PSTR-4-N]MCG7592626.1 hypothetical protein [Mycobacterium sp. PSTR-4-N]